MGGANMGRGLTLVVLAAVLAGACLLAVAASAGEATLARPGAVPERRWFFSFGYLRNRADVETIKSLIRTAADHGLNGIVLSSFGFDAITTWTEEDHAFLREIDALCKEKGIELIPTGFSAGYGGRAPGHDPNWAAALPETITLQAAGGQARPVSARDSLAWIVRRDGTPLELRSADRQVAFVEGVDFEEVENRRDLEALTLPPGSSVREGERLVLSCYKRAYFPKGTGTQVSLCMSNPALYDYWEAQVRRMHEVLEFKKVLLSMDEVRNGGGCLLCRNSGKSMAEIYGDCVTRLHGMFKAVDPEIEVLIWSDMLDPGHNARNNYYGVVGDFTGSHRYVPKDLTIMCWWKRRKAESLAFFSGLGFRTMGACYYDADDLTDSREWLRLLRQTPGAQGIMYSSWRRKYELLGPFGELVSRE